MNALRMALDSIREKKGRSFLTMLGIIIGVTAVLVLVALVSGYNADITAYYEKLGVNKVNVTVNWYDTSRSVDVIDALYDYGNGELGDMVLGVSPDLSTSLPMKYRTTTLDSGTLYLGSDQFSVCGNYTLKEGRDISAFDVDRRSRVCVLGSYVADSLFQYADPIGETVYFGGEPFTTEEIVEGMRKGVKDGLITPVFCGSAVNQQALDMLLFNMHKLLPSPQHDAAILAENASGEPVELHCDENEPTAAYVFKTVADPFVGKLSYLRVISGKVTGGAALVNARTGETEKIGKPLTVIGKKQVETDGIGAGDIGAVAKLVSAKTGDTLCDASRVVKLPAATFPLPSLFMAVTVAKKGDEGKISSALARLMEEDPTLSYVNNAETHQQIIGGLGEQHLDVVKAKLKNKFGVEIGLEAPRIAYRESIRKACQKQGRHKKQTGGHGQFGDVVINFEPCDSEQVVFEEKVFGGSVPKNFFPAVEKGVRLAAEKGVLAGYPVVGLKATLLDGSYHPVDSSEMAFIMAAKLAYKAAMPEAGPVILEPIHTLKAHVPNDNTGDIMGDVTKRRGRVLGMEPDEDGMQTVIAEVPLAELSNFTTFIRQITQGRGWFTTEFARYEILPEMLVPAVVEQAKKLGNLDEGAED